MLQLLFSNIILILAWGLIFFGIFFVVTASIGMLRFNDFFNKTHAAGISDSCGIIMILVGFALLQISIFMFCKFIALALFLLLASPISTHALAKAAMLSGIEKELFEEVKNED